MSEISYKYSLVHSASKACFVSHFIPTASVRYPILDVDEPLCDLGIPCFLCVFLILLGRSHLASIFSSHCAFLGECPVLALAVQRSGVYSGVSWDWQVARCVQPCSFLCWVKKGCLCSTPTKSQCWERAAEWWDVFEEVSAHQREEAERENPLGIIQVLSFGKGCLFFCPQGHLWCWGSCLYWEALE